MNMVLLRVPCARLYVGLRRALASFLEFTYGCVRALSNLLGYVVCAACTKRLNIGSVRCAHVRRWGGSGCIRAHDARYGRMVYCCFLLVCGYDW
jgi:hypothetical protein